MLNNLLNIKKRKIFSTLENQTNFYRLKLENLHYEKKAIDKYTFHTILISVLYARSLIKLILESIPLLKNNKYENTITDHISEVYLYSVMIYLHFLFTNFPKEFPNFTESKSQIFSTLENTSGVSLPYYSKTFLDFEEFKHQKTHRVELLTYQVSTVIAHLTKTTKKEVLTKEMSDGENQVMLTSTAQIEATSQLKFFELWKEKITIKMSCKCGKYSENRYRGIICNSCKTEVKSII